MGRREIFARRTGKVPFLHWLSVGQAYCSGDSGRDYDDHVGVTRNVATGEPAAVVAVAV